MHSNRLAREKSPYLLQHAHNPVDWYPWGEEAFAKARAENKPIFLSVGYSTCHWCHVMERESFENDAVAVVLNRDFVPVKIDREERPDIDRIYMLYVQSTTGGGGWPMSVWLTPELKPFYGGTYFPPSGRYGRPGFIQVLGQISGAWQQQRERLIETADSTIAQLGEYAATGGATPELRLEALDSCYHALRRSFAAKLGGFGSAPKFPRPVTLNFLFRYFARTGEEEARDMALVTLREMAKGGMHDQLGGGFHRYSVDEYWFVPHFEKMLYDQAQLAASYLDAYQLTAGRQYLDIARDIFEYVLRDLRHPDGGFYSAEDADSAVDPAHPQQKSEGAFYIWSADELKSLLGEDRAASFARAFGVRPNGNVDNDPHNEFTGLNILYQAGGPDSAAPALNECREVLLAARNQRPRPHLDDKVLAAWNGLMISAFARGAQVFAATDPDAAARYRDAAEQAWRFVMKQLYDPATRTLFRRWRDGERAVKGFLDDYSAMLQAHLDLYETTFEASYLEMARCFADAMLERLEDKLDGGLYSAEAGADQVLRLKEDYDGAEPAGNSVAAEALLRLSDYAQDGRYRESALRILRTFSSRLNDQPLTLPRMLCAWMDELAPKRQVVLAGPAPAPFLTELRRRFEPHLRVFVNPQSGPLGQMQPIDGATAAYVCENYACQLPVTGVDELSRLLDDRRPTA